MLQWQAKPVLSFVCFSAGNGYLDLSFQGVMSCMCSVAVSLSRNQREVKQRETDVIREGTRSDSD